MKYRVFPFILFLLANLFVFGQDGRMIYRGVPILNITLADGKAESDITRETKMNATMVITNGGGSSFASSQLFTGNITIKGRGNSTWEAPKHPYNIVTCDAAFKKKNVPLFGMPIGSAWSLLADYEDRTAIKTIFTSAISYALGLPWCSRGLKVELYLNGEYRGIYTFCEKVERDVNRINIKDLKITDNSGETLTGGYTIERQFHFQIRESDVSFEDYEHGFWTFKLPDVDQLNQQQYDYIKAYWNDFLVRIYNKPLADTINGYRAVVNPLSFAQYFLLQDLSKNVDAYTASWYITKDRSKKLDAGPGWDWGLTWGAVNSNNLAEPNDIYLSEKCPYYNRMLQDTFFSNLVKATFEKSKGKINQVVADAETYYPQLVASGAVSRDSARWPNIFDPVYYHNYPVYQDNINFFFWFIKQRLYFHERSVYGMLPARPPHLDIN